MAKILIVDDEKLLVKGIKFNLENEGYEVDAVYNGEDALALAQENDYDMIILDLMLPKMDGLEVCRRIREFSKVPIVMLTAKSEDTDKLLGFEYGADDYIAKPFNVLELKARIRAILRRAATRPVKTEVDTRVDGGVIILELSERLAYVGERPVDLTPKEFDLLELLMRSPNCVFSRESLLNTVWGYEYDGENRTVDVHIHSLRAKLKDAGEYIKTIRGVGYKIGG